MGEANLELLEYKIKQLKKENMQYKIATVIATILMGICLWGMLYAKDGLKDTNDGYQKCVEDNKILMDRITQLTIKQ